MHPLLEDKIGHQVLLSGNEAIARGAIEAGVAFTSAYPGTPSSEIALQFFQISRESDLYFEYSANEKVALEIAAGAAMCGLRCMVSMKHVGLNVASDALMTLAYTGVTGSLVVVVADDPFMHSSQNEQDSRYYARLGCLPMIEPSSVHEAKEMATCAFDISEALKLPVLLRTTTRINHATGVVTLGHIRKRNTSGAFFKDPFSYVCIPSVSRKLHPLLLKKSANAANISEESRWNSIEGEGRYGIVCSGISYGYVADAIEASGRRDLFKVLRIGFSHPFPEGRGLRFLEGCEKVLVVEEGEPCLEEAIRLCAQRAGLALPIFGKASGLFSRLFELNPAMVRKVMGSFFDLSLAESPPVVTADLPAIPERAPNLCPGCPHRATFTAIRATLGDEAIYPTDIGCYTLGLLSPLSMGDFLISMGSGLGSAGGFSKATGRKVVAFIGDSTFFHSGLSPLANAVYNGHKFLLVILDNGTTGMTGHQPHPGVDVSHLKLKRNPIDIASAVRGLGVEHVATVNPFHFAATAEAVKRAVESPGVSVLISKASCPLYEKSLPGFRSRRSFFIRRDRCTNQRRCIEMTGCPAFLVSDKGIEIDAHRCTGCSLCAQLCPEKAIQIIPRRDAK